MIKKITTYDGCKKCYDECCSFDFFNADYAPSLTREEVDKIIAKGYSEKMFRKAKTGAWKIRLKKGDKFLQCPFFTNNKCTVYDVVPFDCRLWPFCVMRSEDKKKIVLAMDTVETCSALENVKEKQLKKYSEYLSKELQKKEYLDFFKKNPKLIWDYDWELKILCDLKKLKGL